MFDCICGSLAFFSKESEGGVGLVKRGRQGKELGGVERGETVSVIKCMREEKVNEF